MPDAATLTNALTYTGTLAVAALMLFGQIAAFTIFLALAGTVRLLILAVHKLTRRENSDPRLLSTGRSSADAQQKRDDRQFRAGHVPIRAKSQEALLANANAETLETYDQFLGTRTLAQAELIASTQGPPAA